MLLLVYTPAEAVVISSTGVEVTLEVCPVFEVRIQGQPHEPVIDPYPENNVVTGRVFFCLSE
jgi:hypothetical protein